MRVHDKVVLRYGFSDAHGVIRAVSPDGKMVKVKHGPWCFLGHWLDAEGHWGQFYNFRIVGRTMIGRFVDWYIERYASD